MRPAWFSRRAIGLHLTALVVVPGCFALGWWQLHRALGGNELSWAYTFEWPFFACYGVYMWWKLVHEPPSGQAESAQSVGTAVEGPEADRLLAEEEEQDEELARYNRYLAELNASDEHRRR